MYSDPNHPERQQKEPHKWIKHQRDERHRPAKHKQHTPEEESYHRSSRALSDIKYVCALLAGGARRAGALSTCVALSVAVPGGWDRCTWRACVGARAAILFPARLLSAPFRI